MVLTSGNVSDEPIAYRDDDALERLAGDRRRVPHPRPGHPHPDRRLGGPGVPRPGDRADPPVPRLRPRAAGPAGALRPAGAGLRRRAQEHVLPGPRATTRSSRTTSATWRTPRRCARSPRASRTSAGCSTLIPRSWRMTCTRTTCPPSTRSTCTASTCTASSTTTRTSPPAWPTTVPIAVPITGRTARSSESRSTAPATGPTAPSGAVSSWSPAWPASSGAVTWSRCRCPAARPRSASRGGWRPPTSVPAPRKPSTSGGATPNAGRGHRHGRQGRQRPAHLERGPAVRRRRRAPRRPGHDQLRGPGRHRARAAGRPGRERRLPRRRRGRGPVPDPGRRPPDRSYF